MEPKSILEAKFIRSPDKTVWFFPNYVMFHVDLKCEILPFFLLGILMNINPNHDRATLVTLMWSPLVVI